jgi:asparagine synthetase B (glutamine-hydrolysing)
MHAAVLAGARLGAGDLRHAKRKLGALATAAAQAAAQKRGHGRTVVVGMSGGVDSSVTALLLKDEVCNSFDHRLARELLRFSRKTCKHRLFDEFDALWLLAGGSVKHTMHKTNLSQHI